MRVLRGRVADPVTDAGITERMLDRAADERESAARVWRPPKHCSFGRRDTRSDGYHRAREAAVERGFPPVERSTGGRAVAYTGTTVALARAEPIEDLRDGLGERYDAITTAVQRALWRLGVPAQRGEPECSFCPGGPSLRADGKLAGFGQRVRRNAAIVGGVVIVDRHETVGDVLDPVYRALDVPFDPETVGSVERSGGRADPDVVARTVEAAILDDREPVVERVDQEG